MIYKDIAEIIGMDISTISRVVNSKYVQTDYGVFSLRHFFSDSISTVDGEEVSNKEVKKSLRALIDAEDPLKPLSDHKLAELLKGQGLNIARRTVAKYREAMLIPVARLRRKLT
jgi:RNA polymerase sigma-54 factor